MCYTFLPQFHHLSRKKAAVEEVGKILPALFRTHLRRDDAPLVEIIAPLWSRIAGKEIAGQSQPTAFVAGRLTLSTSCPSWAVQLRRMTQELRAAINCFLGCPVVKKVQVKLTTTTPRTGHPWLHEEPVVAEAAPAAMHSYSGRASWPPKAGIQAGREGRGDRWH